jgi:hypothetical protein
VPELAPQPERAGDHGTSVRERPAEARVQVDVEMELGVPSGSSHRLAEGGAGGVVADHEERA